MGAGKTTLGRQLARRLEMEFVDSDHEIEDRTGVAIPLIFDIEGEVGFRRRERAVIDELTQRRGVVLATGGGAILDAGNRHHLASRGVVVYLSAGLEQLYARVAKDRQRPLLQTDDPRRRLQEILAERDPLYRSIADIIIRTDQCSVRTTVKLVQTELAKAASA